MVLMFFVTLANLLMNGKNRKYFLAFMIYTFYTNCLSEEQRIKMHKLSEERRFKMQGE